MERATLIKTAIVRVVAETPALPLLQVQGKRKKPAISFLSKRYLKKTAKKKKSNSNNQSSKRFHQQMDEHPLYV